MITVYDLIWVCCSTLVVCSMFFVFELFFSVMSGSSGRSKQISNDGNVTFSEEGTAIDEFDRLFNEKMSIHPIEKKREFKDVKGKFVWSKELKKWVLVDRIDLKKGDVE